MDRNREAWRGSMAALNGGLSRRRQQRSTNLRDSPAEEDGVMEMQESSRLRDRDRDRGIKKDRDRDRSGGGSGRSKRRRGERLAHGGNRDDGDESSEESLDEDDDEEEDAPVSVRFPPPPPPTLSTQTNPIPSSSSSSLQQQSQSQSQSNHVRKSFSSTKPARPPAPSWKVAEEMIGVSIPRKARSSSLKRTQECGGGGGSGELIHRQASTSPARPSPSSNTAISPSSSNVSVRKKKPISGSKQRLPKISKSSIQEIEIEVAEVLYGMTRQAPAPPVLPSSLSRQDANGLTNEAKSRVSSPGSFSPVPATSQASVLPGPNLNSSNNNSAPLVTTAPKRKRPRLKLEDESPTSPATKPEIELPPKLEEGAAPASPSRSEKKTAAAACPAVDNGDTALTEAGTVTGCDHMQEPTKQESSSHVPEQKEAKEEIALATTSKSKEVPCSTLNASLDEATVIKDGSAVPKAESPREEKFSIDLMAPPPPPPMGNSERDGSSDYAADHKPIEPVKEMRTDTANGEMEKPDRSSRQQEAVEAASAENTGSSKHVAKEKPMLDLHLDLEKQNKDGLSLGGGSKHQQQLKQQPKAPRIDPKPEKKAQSASSLPMTMPIAGWPGGFPHFGYMGQVPALPAVMPMDGNSAAAKTLQAPHFFPPQKPKRCATHCYIAQTIHYNQQIARMSPFWPPAAAAAAAAAAAVGTSPIYGAKQHNLNLVPSSEAAILGSPLQGSFPGRSLGPLQDKASPAVAMTFAGPPAKEKSSAAAAAANNTSIEAQRKQFLLQQTPQPVSSAAPPNMLHGPAFIFPISQQPAAAAAAVAAAATRSITAKSTPGIGSATPSAASGSSAAAGSGPSGHSTTTMSFNYPGLQPNDTQYLAFLQNNGYPFPIPAHVAGGPSPYRGANPSQAMPFFNGSFYSSPMLHPPSQQQFRQQQQQQPPPTHQQPPAHSQQGHQNTSTSSGSSSSQKHHSQQRLPGGAAPAGATPAGGSSHNFSAKQHLHLLPPQARQLESEAGCEDSPSTADSSRVSQAQKSIYGNFAMSIHPQNFALISPAAVPSSGGGGGGSHNDKPQPVHNQANLTPSQAYAMSFAPFGGPAAAGGAQGLDFSSMVQNHALFHSLPEAARHHGYQQITAVAAAAAAAQAAQHKKSRHEDGKSAGEPGAASANVAGEEGKMMASAGKPPGGVAQHSLSFSRPDNNDLQTSTILGNSSNITEGSSRTLNLIQPPANGGRASNRPSSAAPASNSPVANAANPTTASNLHMQSSQQQQQQQHLIQLQKSQQHQQQLHLQQQMSSRPTKGSSHSSNNATIYSDRMPAGSMSRFSQGALAGLPPSIIQSASAAQSPQWKASGRAATSGPANSATSSSSSAKNQVPQQQQQQQQQQARNQQQHQQALLGSNMHQTQISFGVSSSKAVGVSGQTHLAGGSSNSPLASAAAAAIAAGSPQSAVSKSSAGNGGGGSGSPRASSTSKSGPPPPALLSPALPLHQQTPAGKNSPSPSSSNLKSSSPANNRNMTSILGHPQTNSSSSTKFQQQSQQQQQQQKQSFHQPQLFFSNHYLQAAQSSQPNVAAAAASFYQQQRRQSEQQAHQHSQQSQQQNSTNSGVLSLCPSSLALAGSSPTSDPAKAASAAAAAAAAGVMKGLAPTPGAAGGGILQHNAQYAAAAASSMGQHPLMSSSFPYIQTMSSSVSVKPAGDQKPAPGSENLHWKPEKR